MGETVKGTRWERSAGLSPRGMENSGPRPSSCIACMTRSGVRSLSSAPPMSSNESGEPLVVSGLVVHVSPVMHLAKRNTVPSSV